MTMIATSNLEQSLAGRPVAQPFVKWAGGKRRQVSTILAAAPPVYERYLEPFLGGGAVALALAHRPMLLNDANGELIDAYRAVRDELPGLIALLARYRAGHSEGQFYTVRGLDPSSLTPLERAARLIYLNKTCFNGLWRVNREGRFNTPSGSYTKPQLYDSTKMNQANQALQGAILESEDYADFLGQHARAGDFVYLDPPYIPAGTYADFGRYTKQQFRHDDQVRLAEVYHELVRQGVYLVLSNADTDVARRLYREHCIQVVHAPRVINHQGDDRGVVREILVTPARGTR